MDIVGATIIQLISGAVGGNIAGALLKNFSLGTAGNPIAGVVGGVVGGQILNATPGPGTVPDAAAHGTGGMDIGSIIGSIAGGGVGGGILMIIIGLCRRMSFRHLCAFGAHRTDQRSSTTALC